MKTEQEVYDRIAEVNKLIDPESEDKTLQDYLEGELDSLMWVVREMK